VIDTDAQYDVVGACIVAGGLRMLAPHAAHELAESDVPLESLWDVRGVARLRERLLACVSPSERLHVLEEALIERCRPHLLHPAVAFALEAFAGSPAVTRVDEVVRASGFSARYLIERFKSQVGLTPKRFCRVRRFQLAVHRAHLGRREEWAHIALDCGFYDQAHLINEFRDFAGLPPSAYLAGRTPHQNHVTFVQSATSGDGGL
jgi:AraC-like DNA-binding protein